MTNLLLPSSLRLVFLAGMTRKGKMDKLLRLSSFTPPKTFLVILNTQEWRIPSGRDSRNGSKRIPGGICTCSDDSKIPPTQTGEGNKRFEILSSN